MANSDTKSRPDEGELVVASISEVQKNGAYVKLDEYNDLEGFIFIGEIASGWVKNIRSVVREGQRVICKTIGVRKDGASIELSLKSVSEERRRNRLQEWKNEQRAKQLLKVMSEQLSWSAEKLQKTEEELAMSFTSLYSAFEEAAMNETAMADAGYDDDWVPQFIEIAVENIVPPFVEIRGNFQLKSENTNGVEIVRDALLAAESFTNEDQEISVECFYDGSPNYRIELKAPDFKTAEEVWEKATQATTDFMIKEGGEAEVWRE
ncbi:MAG: translation initiation factor IF-2 subunit alpha [Candidatus Thermoplasmatota archaeon]|nr:translation initiation factor IF-2 subunit alpha [Candidatus Thermoplasmatota archaeon]